MSFPCRYNKFILHYFHQFYAHTVRVSVFMCRSNILHPVNFFCYCKDFSIEILFWVDNEHESIKRAEIDMNDR